MTNQVFAGSGTLTRLIFRRDRIRLSVWLIAIVGFVVAMVPVFETIFAADGSVVLLAEMMENPAMVAIVGPVYGIDNYHTGAAFANMMLVFSVMIAAAMNILLITRHTRQDEELGRLEVIRSLPAGRLSNLAAAMSASLIVNVLLAVITGLGLYAVRKNGMDFSGCMLFGAAMGVIGLFFAAATALFCQLTANNRTASGISFLFMMILYMMRAAGDIGTEALSLISPLGLVLRTENFVKDAWWPIWVILGISVVFAILAFALATIRDLGRGLFPERPGKRHASGTLSGAFGLALRLLKTPIIIWSLVIFIFAAMYGSIFGDLEGFIGKNETLAAIFAANTEFSLTEQFIGLLMTVMSLIATIPVLSFVHRVASEEKNGYTEHLFGKAISRPEQLAAYFVPAFVMSVLFQFLTALGFWSVGSMVLDTAPDFKTFLAAAFVYLPAIWVFMGASMVLIAFLPDKAFLSFAFLAYTFISVYIGTIAGLPEWMQKITPFGHIPQYPMEDIEPVALSVLGVIAVFFVVISFWGYRRRDFKMQ